MVVHEDCGAEVVAVGGVWCERLMHWDGSGVFGVVPVVHVCRDFVAWHRPADRRDLDVLVWPGGEWRPRLRPAVPVGVAA